MNRQLTAHSGSSLLGPCFRGWPHPSAHQRRAPFRVYGPEAWLRHDLRMEFPVRATKKGNTRQCLTMMAEVEAPVHPDAIFGYGRIVLGVHWPLPPSWDRGFVTCTHSGLNWEASEMLFRPGVRVAIVRVWNGGAVNKSWGLRKGEIVSGIEYIRGCEPWRGQMSTGV